METAAAPCFTTKQLHQPNNNNGRMVFHLREYAMENYAGPSPGPTTQLVEVSNQRLAHQFGNLHTVKIIVGVTDTYAETFT